MLSLESISKLSLDKVVEIFTTNDRTTLERLRKKYLDSRDYSEYNDCTALYDLVCVRTKLLGFRSQQSKYFERIISELEKLNEQKTENKIEDFGELEEGQYYFIADEVVPAVESHNSRHSNMTYDDVPVWAVCHNSKLECGELRFTLNPFDLDTDSDIMLVPYVRKMQRNDLDRVHDIYSNMNEDEVNKYYTGVRKLYPRNKNLNLRRKNE